MPKLNSASHIIIAHNAIINPSFDNTGDKSSNGVVSLETAALIAPLVMVVVLLFVSLSVNVVLIVLCLKYKRSM